MSGLSIVAADVVKFSSLDYPTLKIPHMCWNTVSPYSSPLTAHMFDNEQRYYFVHSYKVIPDNPDITIFTCDYGVPFCAGFQQDSIYGVQFHPEKSSLWYEFDFQLLFNLIMLRHRVIPSLLLIGDGLYKTRKFKAILRW